MMKLNKFIDKNIPALNGKLYIVTGANSGIGFEMAKILLNKGAKVIFACRNKDRAIEAINSLDDHIKSNAIYIHFDQSDFLSIDAFLCEIITKYPQFEGIILNAGILKPKNESLTKQGFKSVVGTNYLGIIYLVERLKQLDKCSSKKIVFQSSLMAKIGTYKSNELLTASSAKFHAYNISKMGVNHYFKYCLDNDNNFSYYLAEPGACYSNIYQSFPKFILPLANVFMRLVFHSAKKGGLSALMLLTNQYDNGTILYPRGLLHMSGYPKKGKLAKKLKKSRDILRDGFDLVDPYL